MSSLGFDLRLSRIIDPKSGAAVLITMDHGVEGYYKELQDPRATVRAIIEGGATSFLLRRGLARFICDEIRGKAGFVYRVTTATGLRDKFSEQIFLTGVEEALRIGADAVVPTFFIGAETEVRDFLAFGHLADKCHEWGMPLLAEVFPIGGPGTEPFAGPYSVDEVRDCCRAAAEEGADFIKTYYTGSPDSFKKVVDYCPVPVLIAGGAKIETPLDVLKMVKGAMDAGGKGIAAGRNIWQYKNPKAMARALSRIIKEHISVEEAAKELK